MKKIWYYGAFTLSIFLLLVISQIPANQVYALLKSNSQLPVSLYQISGSAWQGQATVADIGVNRLEEFRWKLHPWALIQGRLQARIQFSKGTGKMTAVSGRTFGGKIFLHDVDGQLPLNDIESFISKSPMGLIGDLDIKLENLTLSDHLIDTVEGILKIDSAGLGPPIDTTIGNFKMVIDTTDEGIRGVLSDTGGPLQTEGLLLIQPDGSYKLTAEITLRDTSRSDLQNALRLIGTPNPDGKVAIVQSGKLDLEKMW